MNLYQMNLSDKSRKVLFLFFSICFLIFPLKVFSQVCNGSLGDPVVSIDFGRGASFFGPALGSSTNYMYVASQEPSDGFYTIEKNVSSASYGGAWFPVANHTPNDPDGYLMMVNASNLPGIFYETEVNTDLCPNTTYEFAAWVANVLTFSGIKPNLTFLILTNDNQVLSSYNTGDIPESNQPTWKQYGFLFTTIGNVTRVKIRIINNAPGGTGNDLALDDITFRPCGPKIITTVNSSDQIDKTFCEQENTPIVISTQVEGSLTLKYLWQKNEGKGWTDLSNETSTQLNVQIQSLTPGTYQYRMVAAEANNFNSPACRTASPTATIHIKPVPKPVVAAQQSVCLGNSILLNVNDAEGTYLWKGPNNYSSTEKSPVITNAAFNMTGTYRVTVTSDGCSATAACNVTVLPPPAAAVDQPEVSLCEGSTTRLNASGGTIYKWTPEIGLSAADIADPIANPSSTTLYQVTVSNGACENTAHVLVTVFKKTTADAGNNKTIIEGQSIALNGKASGDHIKQLWSPADYLDDPTKLNPIATPPKDITYVLNVYSEEGCPASTSSVSIHVLKKIIVQNTFTPNGDNINDVWHIEALDAYPAAEIKVMNRYGEKVFSSTSGLKSWDGKYRGTDVPTGTYYYIINLHNGQKDLSGFLTILR